MPGPLLVFLLTAVAWGGRSHGLHWRHWCDCYVCRRSHRWPRGRCRRFSNKLYGRWCSCYSNRCLSRSSRNSKGRGRSDDGYIDSCRYISALRWTGGRSLFRGHRLAVWVPTDDVLQHHAPPKHSNLESLTHAKCVKCSAKRELFVERG